MPVIARDFNTMARSWSILLKAACLVFAVAVFSTAYSPASGQGLPDDEFKSGMAAKNRSDLASARMLFKRACEKDHPYGCYNLGHMLLKGDGGTVDLPGARSAYLRACNAGHSAGCSEFGTMLATGQGGAGALPGASSGQMAGNSAATLTPVSFDEAQTASDLAALKSGLMKLAANSDWQIRGLAGSTKPRTWTVSSSPQPIKQWDTNHPICSVRMNRDFAQRDNQTFLTYASSLEERTLEYTPWRGQPVAPKIVPVLVQHSSGLNEVFFMKWERYSMKIALDPEQDRLMREALSQPGTFHFTHHEITTFEVNDASDQLAVLGACEAQLQPKPAPVSLTSNLADLDRLIENRQWDDALRAVLRASQIEKSRFLLKFHQAPTSDSRHAPTIELLRQNKQIFDQAIHGSVGAQRSQLQRVKADLERDMNPRGPSAAPQEGDWTTFTDGMDRAMANTVGECTAAGGKVSEIGSTKWCD